MKKMVVFGVAGLLMASRGLMADKYYNNHTVSENASETEAVYIGHIDGDGGADSAANAQVTVNNGAIWTIGSNLYLGNAAGASRLDVAADSSLYVNDPQNLVVGNQGGGSATLTNYGEIDTYYLLLGNYSAGNSIPRFDNHKSLIVRYALQMGEKNGVTEESVLHNHPGATLSVRRQGSKWGFYIGSRAPARLINQGKIESDTILRVGGANTPSGTGVLVMSNTAEFVSNQDVWVGNKGAKGTISLHDGSTFGTSATVYLPYMENSTASVGELSLNDNSVLESSQLVLGRIAGGHGIVTVADNARMTVPNIVVNKGSGSLSVDGTAELELDELLVGRNAGDDGELTVSGEISVPKRILVGSSHDDKAESVTGRLTVAENAFVVCTNIAVGFSKFWSGHSRRKDMYGELTVKAGAVVSNAVVYVGSARENSSYGHLKMEGGTVLFNSVIEKDSRPLQIGTSGDYSSGFVRGRGTLAFIDPMDVFVTPQGYADCGQIGFLGQVIAAGGTLDCGRIGTPGFFASSNNTCGTNGWYAVSGGLLKLPRSLPRKTADYACVGDYPINQSNDYYPSYVNSFKYVFDEEAADKTGTYVFSELYAADRTDIPAGLPSGDGVKVSAVWRIGYFNETATPLVEDTQLASSHRQAFDSVKLKFRYDPSLAQADEVHRIRVYRCVDSANGGWQRVGSAAPSSERAEQFVETREFSQGSEVWNVGWLAIVAEPKKCTAIIVR